MYSTVATGKPSGEELSVLECTINRCDPLFTLAATVNKGATRVTVKMQCDSTSVYSFACIRNGERSSN